MITHIKEKDELKTTELISFKKRRFLPENEKLESFEAVKKYIDDLLSRKIDTTEDLKKWLHDREELENVLFERMDRKYIAFTREATNPQL
ncbi:MAG: M3 family oligoendopeptidase [Chlorobi bacterium]|nr:M3 family oligoendopeptidase [Chlorobiota bacterium]